MFRNSKAQFGGFDGPGRVSRSFKTRQGFTESCSVCPPLLFLLPFLHVGWCR